MEELLAAILAAFEAAWAERVSASESPFFRAGAASMAWSSSAERALASERSVPLVQRAWAVASGSGTCRLPVSREPS